MKPLVAQYSLKQLQEELQSETNHYLTFTSCKTLLNFFHIELESVSKQIPLIDMLKWSVLKQFNEDPLSGFFEDN